MTADIDSTVIARLMDHDAFAHGCLGSSALMIIGALRVRPVQTVSQLAGTASVSRATAYRTLQRLADQGLVQHTGETWTLAPRAVDGFGDSPWMPPRNRAPGRHRAGTASPSATARRAPRSGAGLCTRSSERHTKRHWTGARNTAAKPP